jgi:hypothetical protein
VAEAVAIVYHHHQNYCLTVIGIGACNGVAWCDNSRPAVLGHVFRFHREGGWGGIAMAECAREVKVGFEEWVEAKVSAKAQPVVCVDDVVIIPVDDGNIPTHQTHLQAKNGMVGTIVG